MASSGDRDTAPVRRVGPARGREAAKSTLLSSISPSGLHIPLEITRPIVLLSSDMGKPESKGEQTRRTIVSRALGIVSDVGYEGLSIGALAEESKLSKSGLFAHFKSKEALQLGVIEEVVARFILRVVQPALTSPRGEPRV